MDCREVEKILYTEGPDAAPEAHLAECESCRHEHRRAADLRAALTGLRSRFATPPPELESALIAVATRQRLARAKSVVSHPKFWRGAAVGAAAAATAAVGLFVARRRISTKPAADLVA